MAIKFGVNLATPNPGGRDGSIATQKTNISSSLFTMCREWHAALLLSLSCWLGLSRLGPYGPLRYRAPCCTGGVEVMAIKFGVNLATPNL